MKLLRSLAIPLVLAACAATPTDVTGVAASSEAASAVALFRDACVANVGDFSGVERYAASAGLPRLAGAEMESLRDGLNVPRRQAAWRGRDADLNVETHPAFDREIVICEIITAELDRDTTRRALQALRVAGRALGPPEPPRVIAPGFPSSGMTSISWRGSWGGALHYSFPTEAGDLRKQRLEISGLPR